MQSSRLNPVGSCAGREFFDSLDRDRDGEVSLDDMKAAMRARNLPERYAKDFIRTARGSRWWSQSIKCAACQMLGPAQPKL